MLCLMMLLTYAQGAWAHTISGDFNDWIETDNISEGGNYEISLAANTTYEFRFCSYGQHYGYNGEITSTLSECVQFMYGDNKGKLITGPAGTYIFTHCDGQRIKVTYPEEPSEDEFKINLYVGDWHLLPATLNSEGTAYECTYTASNCNDGKIQYYKNGKYYGQSGKMTRDNCTDWNFPTEDAQTSIDLDISGEYKFSISKSNEHVSVTYPDPSLSLVGGFNEWDFSSGLMTKNNRTYTKEVLLDRDNTYEFLIGISGWGIKYGKNGEDAGKTITRTSNSMVLASKEGNAKIQADETGTYTFTFNIDSKNLEVSYPASCTPPTITSHPSTDPKTYTQGETATALSVTASGTAPLSYQWQKSTDGSNYSDISGATSSSYTPETTVAGTTYYKCKVTGQCGEPATSNASGAIKVTAGSDITVTPASPKAYEVITLSTRSGGDMVWSKTAGSDDAYFVNADGTTTSDSTTAESIKFKAPADSYTITATPAAGESVEITFTVGADSDNCN